jgi:hypothetical protein
MLPSNEPRSTHSGIIDEWSVEGKYFTAQQVAHEIPAQWIGPVEIHISRRASVHVHTNAGTGDVSAGLPAISAYAFEPGSFIPLAYSFKHLTSQTY